MSSSKLYFFIADVKTKTVTKDCTLNPSKCTKEHTYWLWALNNKYPPSKLESSKTGKWMLFPKADVVDHMWNKVKEAIEEGHLWQAKVSTADNAEDSFYTVGEHVVIIYTKDFEDIEDVISVLEYLESSGIKPEGKTIKYKTDEQTLAGVYATRPGVKKQKASIYDSNTIRNLAGNNASNSRRRSYSGNSDTNRIMTGNNASRIISRSDCVATSSSPSRIIRGNNTSGIIRRSDFGTSRSMTSNNASRIIRRSDCVIPGTGTSPM